VSEEIAGAPPAEEPAAPPPEPVAEPVIAAPIDEDAALDAEIESTAIDLPGEDKLVPLSAVTKVREKYKSAKAENATLTEKASRADRLEQQLREAAPYIEAARAMLEAKQQPPAAPEPVVEDDSEALAMAQALDLYTPDGKPDVNKAKTILTVVDKRAESKANASAAPLVQRTLSTDANNMLARAKATVLPGTQDGADADILDSLWQRVASQPGGLAQLANPESAKVLWNQAFTLTQVRRAQQPKKTTPAPMGEPLFTEKAGGRDTPGITLDDGDRRVAKDMGMTVAEYTKMAAEMPWTRKK
jgi:hypothetical protein